MTLCPVEFTIKRPSYRYADELIRLRCGPDLLISGVFPNAKEVSESFGAYSAVRRHLRKQLGLFNDPGVAVVCIGDGCTPRTAATFAFRSRWTCWSVDPALKSGYVRANNQQAIDRLWIIQKRAEDWNTEVLEPFSKVLIVAVHSHADLQVARSRINAPHVSVVAIPCCVKQELDSPPDLEYRDVGIWSPHNLVKIWRKA